MITMTEKSRVDGTAKVRLLLHQLLSGAYSTMRSWLGVILVGIKVEAMRKGRNIADRGISVDILVRAAQGMGASKGGDVRVCAVMNARFLLDKPVSQLIIRVSGIIVGTIGGVLVFSLGLAISIATNRTISLTSRLLLGGRFIGDTVVTILHIGDGFALTATTLLDAGRLGRGLGRGQILQVVLLLDLSEANLSRLIRARVLGDERLEKGWLTLAEAAFFRLE